MSEKAKSAKAAHLDSREALLQAAARVFAEKGFEGATVKDLADEAKVNVSLVSYHFGGKEGLYKAVLELMGRTSLNQAERVLKAPTTAEEFKIRLRLFAESFIENHLQYADVCRIIHRDFDKPLPITREVYNETFFPMYKTLVAFFAAAQTQGFLRADVRADLVVGFVFGSLVHALRSDEIRTIVLGPDQTITNESFKQELIDHYIKMACEGLFVRGEKE